MASSAEEEERHASKPDSLSRAWVIKVSKLSNFFARSSMADVTEASNFVGFHGARAQTPRTNHHELSYVPQ